MVTKGEEVGKGIDWEFGVSRGKLLYKECLNNKVLLYNRGIYIYIWSFLTFLGLLRGTWRFPG